MRSFSRAVLILFGIASLTGCVAYAPYPEYSAAPYAYSYSYGYVRPAPFYRGGWRHHHNHHDHHLGHH